MEKRSDPLHRIPPILLERARAMRRDPATSEQKLWACLRARQLDGHKFKRQYRAGPFIADFFCASARLIVELDGDSHAEREKYDEDRTTWLRDNGYSVIRFVNEDVHRFLDAVLETILREVEARITSKTTPSP